MKIAITGATGFVGRELVTTLIKQGHQVRAWHRPSSNREGFEEVSSSLEWVEGELGNMGAVGELIQGCDAVVHSALSWESNGFRGSEGNLVEFAQKNIIGSLQLFQESSTKGIQRFVFISTCTVHEKILDDRALDESHPLWATSHYGAHKAALEKFVHSYGYGQGFPICALRPTGIYGKKHQPEESKWYDLIRDVAAGAEVTCARGGKEVHVNDVAKAVLLLLKSDSSAGEAYSCYDRYVSQYDVANIAKEICGSPAVIHGELITPKHQISTEKLKSLGMKFGGDALLREYIEEILEVVG